MQAAPSPVFCTIVRDGVSTIIERLPVANRILSLAGTVPKWNGQRETKKQQRDRLAALRVAIKSPCSPAEFDDFVRRGALFAGEAPTLQRDVVAHLMQVVTRAEESRKRKRPRE